MIHHDSILLIPVSFFYHFFFGSVLTILAILDEPGKSHPRGLSAVQPTGQASRCAETIHDPSAGGSDGIGNAPITKALRILSTSKHQGAGLIISSFD